MDCIFCLPEDDSVKNDILFDSAHFYVKSCLASVAAGHVLLIPKKHYPCYGALLRELEDEYLIVKKKVVDTVKERFSEPFLLEHGVWGQSVAHAHIHCIPLVGEGYSISSILEEMIYPSQISYVEGGLDVMRKMYANEGAYILYEERGRSLVCHVAGFSKQEWMPKIGFRHFFRRIFPDTVLVWKDASEEQICRDRELRAVTRRNFGF